MPRSTRGWVEFRSKGRRLLVKNIDRSNDETITGADLVYVRRDPDALVLVQYKMLDELNPGNYVYRRDPDRLHSQIERMLQYESLATTGSTEPGMGSYRIGPGFSFVKFIQDPGSKILDLDELTPGVYLPAAVAKMMLDLPDAGPRGGKIYHVRKRRYIDTETFARLVQDSWVGSTGRATEILINTLGLMPMTLRENLILAVDEPE